MENKVWNLTTLYSIMTAACELLKTKDKEEAKKKIVKIGMEAWELIDPTITDLDDAIVQGFLSWLADRIIDDVGIIFTQDTSRS